ncbi:hypothetical protein [Beduini massiliensis]|uniref:hypothetical protein n=1 Tax=Beduini massiliensis TaxID=1585974 RepID=UPI00059A90E0|nr:hypothetical protein [Beduini massiliensis]
MNANMIFGLLFICLSIVSGYLYKRCMKKWIFKLLLWVFLYIGFYFLLSTSLVIIPLVCYMVIIYFIYKEVPTGKVDERKKLPKIVWTLIIFLLIYLIPGSFYHINREITLDNALESFPDVTLMQEIVGEEIPIKMTQDDYRLNDRLISHSIIFQPLEENTIIDIQHVFAQSRHTISQSFADAADIKNKPLNPNEFFVNDFIVSIKYVEREDGSMEIRYKAYNDQILIEGYGIVPIEWMSEEDEVIVKNKVVRIIEAF